MEAVKSAEGREYTIADDKGPSTIILRSKKGVFVTPAYVQELEQAQQIFGVASYLLQTRDGSLLIAASEIKFIVYSLAKKTLLYEEECRYIYSMSLSPNEKFLQVLDKVDANEGKTTLYDLSTLTKTLVLQENAYTNYYLKTSYPLVRFTADDSLSFRYNSKTIEVYNRAGACVRVIKSGPL